MQLVDINKLSGLVAALGSDPLTPPCPLFGADPFLVIVAHVGNLDTLSDLQVTGIELQIGFHMFIFGVDLRVDRSLMDSKDWRVDIETLDVKSVQSCKPGPVEPKKIS